MEVSRFVRKEVSCMISILNLHSFSLTFVSEAFLEFFSEGLRALDIFHLRGKFIPQTYSFIAYHSPNVLLTRNIL